MKLNIIKVGNSMGIRLPKSILEQCGFKDSVIVQVKNGKLVITADNKSRANWSNKFRKMAEEGDDKLIDKEIFELESDNEDWQW